MERALRIHHIGYVVRDLERSRKRFAELGYVEEGGVFNDESRTVHVVFLVKDGYRMELISPNGEESIVNSLLDKAGDTPYHICYETVDLDAQIQTLEQQSYVIADPPKPAVALGGRRVAFLYRAGVGLIELVESGVG